MRRFVFVPLNANKLLLCPLFQKKAEFQKLMLQHTNNNKQSHTLKYHMYIAILLSYAIFNYHIPIYDHSSGISENRQRQW